MNTRGMLRSVCAAVAVAAVAALASPSAHAQAVGDAAPVAEKQGLLGTYYRFTGATPPAATPTSPVTPRTTTATLLGEELTPILNTDFVANRPAVLGASSDMFMAEWTGRVVIGTTEAYTFFTASDDGERSWFVDVAKATPDLNFWVQRGVVEDPLPTPINLTPGMMNVRIEFEQGNGGAACYFRWQTATIAKAIVPTANLRPPPGPAAPTLTANSPIGGGPAVVNLSWNQPAGATAYIISRQTVSTPAPNTPVPMRVIALINSGATLNYVDNAVVFGASYNYIIQATSNTNVCIGPASATQAANPTQPWVIATPNTGLQTSENLTTTNFDIIFTQPAPAGNTTITVTSSDISEGTVAANGLATTPVANGFSFTVLAGQSPTINVIVTGVDDAQVDGAIAYTVNINATNITGPQSPPVNLTNNDNDIQGLTFTRTSGLITTESGGQAQFSVFLNRQPFNNVSFTLTSNNTLEGTVLPGTLTFTATGGAAYNPANGFGGWNVAHEVTVTGVDDALLDFTIPYTIITGPLQFVDTADQNAFTAAGVTSVPDVSAVNFDNEVPPALPEVWGSAGCGLLGLELAAPILLAGLLRRRRR